MLELFSEAFVNDPFPTFKRFLSSNRWFELCPLISYTRHYKAGMNMLEYLERMLTQYRRQLTNTEYRKFDGRLIVLRLNLYDKLDQWTAFIDLFDRTLADKDYATIHKIDAYVFPNDPNFERYLLKVTDKQLRVHILYELDARYQIIKRKIRRSLKTGKLNNLRHHPQSELSEIEIQRRFNSMIKNIIYR